MKPPRKARKRTRASSDRGHSHRARRGKKIDGAVLALLDIHSVKQARLETEASPDSPD